ncbi:GAD-like domain-containing protein [Flocculibacter collagenilyticus]|uniref:GAD-like domain-containing protein n=1 Tax=Flocculibacter collagenilyticus TaxID=2744479 RepID=UPI0018F740B9|nr:GAD-like domain-containing protein [Flocculibacter collagenilyticus]
MAITFELDEYFECFLEEFGTPNKHVDAEEYIFKKYKGKLPDRLLAYWKEYGFCSFKSGLFWLVNPEHYEDSLEAWLGETEIVEKDSYYVIARSAYGDLYLWGEKTGFKYELIPTQGWVIEKKGNIQDIEDNNVEKAIKMFFYKQDPESIDIENSNGELLAEQCKVAHGELNYDEVYAFEPALFLGGAPELENVKKVNIFAHLAVLASFGQLELLDKDALINKAFG